MLVSFASSFRFSGCTFVVRRIPDIVIGATASAFLSSLLYPSDSERGFFDLTKANKSTTMAELTGDAYASLQAIADTTGQFTTNFFKIQGCAPRWNPKIPERAPGGMQPNVQVVADEYPGNLIASPVSAQFVLIMAAYGAAGNTAIQMRSALQIPGDNERGQSGYNAMIESFNAAEGVDLRFANKIYTASGFEVNPAFQELMSRIFSSPNEQVDFGNSVNAAAIINAWCAEQTKDRIKNIIDPDSLDPSSQMVLVNAVYFNGKWEHKFNSDSTKDRPFHTDEKSTKNVPTMWIKEEFRHGDLPELNAKFIEIPYDGDQFSMIIILPNEINGLKQVQENLHRLNLKEKLQRTWPYQIELFLPKFKIESTMDLEGTLKKMGMTDMFENSADFSGISETPIKISEVLQKAFIEVDEEGSAAVAVTFAKAVPLSAVFYSEPPPKFRVDHPYYYVIYHRATGISLFTGIVQEPHWA